MKLASIERISKIETHPNADRLECVKVLGYNCIVPRDVYNENDLVIFIQPDSVLPKDALWAEPFRKSAPKRVKAIKLRDVWSFGIVLSVDSVKSELEGVVKFEGTEVSKLIGIKKYEAPMPQDLSAKGYMPSFLKKADEERYQNILDELPWGTPVDVTLKIDGKSATYYYNAKAENYCRGICSRNLMLHPEKYNHYTAVEKKYKILEKLEDYCRQNNVNLAISGEIYGPGIQSHAQNPHAKKPLGFAAFSVWNIDERRYEGPDSPHYFELVCNDLDIPIVPILERNVPITKDLIKKYESDLTDIDGDPFEGVVIKYPQDSFKVINLAFDSRK
jgi:RNA ligase (TIGR02306 family)